MPHSADLLRELGLKDAAAKIYLYLLKAKKATILEIAKRTGIARTNIYHNLDTLKRAYLVSTAIEGKRTFWVPESPENLVRLMLNKTTVAREAAKLLDEEYKKNRHEAKIRFAEGEEGFKKFAEVLLQSKEKTIRQIVNLSSLMSYTDMRFMQGFWRRRIEQGIIAKILCSVEDKSKVEAKQTLHQTRRMLRQIRVLPNGLSFETSIFTYDDKVQFFAPKAEGYMFIFESATFSRTIKNLFDFLWEVSTPL